MSKSRKTNLPSPSQFTLARSESDLIVKVKEVFFQKFSVIVEKDGLDLIVNPEKNLFSAESFLRAEPEKFFSVLPEVLLQTIGGTPYTRRFKTESEQCRLIK